MSNSLNKVAKWWLGLGLAGVAAVAIFSDNNSDRPPLRPSNEVTLSAEQRDALTTAIALQGYNCPAAKLAFKEGPDAYGDVLKVHCGPEHMDGVYEKAVFRVTFTPDDRIAVRPW